MHRGQYTVPFSPAQAPRGDKIFMRAESAGEGAARRFRVDKSPYRD